MYFHFLARRNMDAARLALVARADLCVIGADARLTTEVFRGLRIARPEAAAQTLIDKRRRARKGEVVEDLAGAGSAVLADQVAEAIAVEDPRLAINNLVLSYLLERLGLEASVGEAVRRVTAQIVGSKYGFEIVQRMDPIADFRRWYKLAKDSGLADLWERTPATRPLLGLGVGARDGVAEEQDAVADAGDPKVEEGVPTGDVAPRSGGLFGFLGFGGRADHPRTGVVG